jgi:hypothetical protein
MPTARVPCRRLFASACSGEKRRPLKREDMPMRTAIRPSAWHPALLRAYGGNRVLTFNPRDFKRYDDIEIVAPPL